MFSFLTILIGQNLLLIKQNAMKKITILLFVVLLGWQANAQKCFEKGNVLLNPGVGLLSNYVGNGYGYGVHPSFFFSADFGVHDYVSVGPYVGTNLYKDALGVAFGARGNFHWWQLLDDKVSKDLKQNQLELYATLWLGYQIYRFDNYNNSRYKASRFGAGFTQGIRWYPKANQRFALYGEFGYTPIAFSTLGCTIRIGKK